MERSQIIALIAWKNHKNRKPLILQGARQVGKTHLLKKFAAESYNNIAYLNFELKPDLATLFERDLDPESLVRKLEIALDTKINVRDTLIIFDEVQLCSRALTSLKYFAEAYAQDPQKYDYHIIAAGSQLGINVSSSASFPVGKVNLMTMYPLTFLEFVRASRNSYYDLLLQIHKDVGEGSSRGFIDLKIPDNFHFDLLELLNVYFFIGGMPEAVKVYIDTLDLKEVRLVQEAILLSYLSDFSKYSDASQSLKVRRIWESLPAQLARENKKFIFSAVAKSARAREYETSLQWLKDAGLLLLANLVENPQVPLRAFADPESFKVFALDVGLLGCMVKLDAKQVVLIKDLYFQFRGALAENFIAQELFAHGHNPIYYFKKDSSAEVDFMIDHESQSFAIEVKSGENKTSKSLNALLKKHAQIKGVRLSSSNINFANSIIEMPLYLTSALGNLS